jgi:hypothetical protein
LPDPLPGAARTVSEVSVADAHGSRRRQLIVDMRYQLRAGVLVGTVAIVLLVLLNASLILQHSVSSGRPLGVPTVALRPAIAERNGSSLAILIVGSVVLFGGVVLVGILESHRTAGAAFAIRRAVDAIREGQTQVRVRLRRGDHLQELAQSINQLAESIDAERLHRERPTS